jgi:hypothetical protein
VYSQQVFMDIELLLFFHSRQNCYRFTIENDSAIYQNKFSERRLRRTHGLLGRNGSMVGCEILTFTKESILLTLVTRLVVLEALADMAICLSLLVWHIELLVFKMRGGRSELHFGGLAALR